VDHPEWAFEPKTPGIAGRSQLAAEDWAVAIVKIKNGAHQDEADPG
jgi:hypothetical protein